MKIGPSRDHFARNGENLLKNGHFLVKKGSKMAKIWPFLAVFSKNNSKFRKRHRGVFFILKKQSLATFCAICDLWSVGTHHFYFDHKYQNLGHFRPILGKNAQILDNFSLFLTFCEPISSKWHR